MEMARSCGVRVNPRLDDSGALSADLEVNPYRVGDIQRIVDDWLPLTFALNSINRCMGQPDLYPFILTPPVIAKLGFIHDLIQGAGAVAPIRPS
jgi:hypothetical protein